MNRERVEAATEEMSRHEERAERKRRLDTLRNSPLQGHLRWVAAGGRPSPVEIDELAQALIDGSERSTLSFAELRRRLRDATESVAKFNSEGQFGQARSLADEITHELIEKLGDYSAPPTEASQEMDPAKLAAQVPRF